jgi:lysophospholipase L1-like esterase
MAAGRSGSRGAVALAFLVASLSLVAGACGSDDEDPDPVSDHLIVSIGDSVASGEGNPDRPATAFRRARWQSRRCHRSARSGHALAATQLLGPDQPGRMVLLGCSGATIRRGLLGPYRGIAPSRDGSREPAQVDRLRELAEGHDISAVLLSVGANDIGFGRIVQFCIFKEPCPKRAYDPEPGEPGPTPPLEEYMPEAIEELAQDYRVLDAALRRAVSAREVIVVEYFDPTSAPAGAARGGNCGMFFGGVSPAESRWAREEVLGLLNDQIRESAEEFGWLVVDDVDEEFAGHGICAGRQRYVTTARESVFGHGIPLAGNPLDRQTHRELLGSFAGTLHPNGAGHRATAELIVPLLEQLVVDTR